MIYDYECTYLLLDIVSVQYAEQEILDHICNVYNIYSKPRCTTKLYILSAAIKFNI